MSEELETTKRAASRHRLGAAWLPRQQGAWAMMAAPPITGLIIGPARPLHIIEMLAWLAGYLAYQDVLGILKANRQATRNEFRVPLIVYGGCAVVGAGILLCCQPHLLWWAPAFAVLTLGSVLLAVTGHARSVANDAATIAAACLLTPVTVAIGLDASPTPGSWLAGAILFGYLVGTIFYVKTMIRERGSVRWYVTSVAYHVVLAAAGFIVGPVAGIVATFLLARAATVPKVWPRARPAAIGIGEIVATIIVVVVAVIRTSSV